MKEKIIKKINIFFIIIEIAFTTIIFSMFNKFTENYDILPNEYKDSLFLNVMINLIILFLLITITLYIVSKINQKITKEKFVYLNAYAYLILGILVLIILSFLVLKIGDIFIDIEKIEKTINSFLYYLLIFIGIFIPILGFNIGLRRMNTNSNTKERKD